MKCGVPSQTLGRCDLNEGHEGGMHTSAGDGFYASCCVCRRPLISGEWGPPADPNALGFSCKSCLGQDDG